MRTLLPAIALYAAATVSAPGERSASPQDASRFQVGVASTTDVATGLEWAGRDNGAGIGWRSAVSHCEGLTFAGFSDWRLPTIFELEALYRAVEDRAIEKTSNGTSWHPVPGIRPSGTWFWSSTPATQAGSDGSWTAWGLSFSGGTRGASNVDDVYNSTTSRAWCVRRAKG